MENKIYTFDPQKNKLVLAGRIKKKVFWKTVNSKHFMRKLNSYGIQNDVLQTLQDLKITKIRIKTKTQILESALSMWVEYALIREYGHGKQYFLSVNYMKVVKK